MMLILCCSLDHGELINARRRAAYRNNKTNGLDYQQVSGQSARR